MKGLVFGKFLPPHKGHIGLIQDALAHPGITELEVLVCSLPDLKFGNVLIKREAVPGVLRANWIKSIFANEPRVKVHLIHEENPQNPDDHSIFWHIWAGVIKQWAGAVDVIFTSEEYGETLKGFLGADHVKVDGWRIKNRIAGHEIIADPIENWAHIMPQSRSFFIKRIVLLGPESVGKSTTGKKIAQKIGCSFVPEAGDSPAFSACGFTEETFAEILTLQKTLEDQLAFSSESPFLICDTDAIQTVTWWKWYLGTYPPDWATKMATDGSQASLYTLLEPTVEWRQNAEGTRKFSNAADRIKFAAELISYLRMTSVPFHYVWGDTFEKRETQIMKEIGLRFGKYPSGHQS